MELTYRPDSSLGGLTPDEFCRRWTKPTSAPITAGLLTGSPQRGEASLVLAKQRGELWHLALER